MAFNALMRPSTMPLVDDYIGITVFSPTGYMHKERDKLVDAQGSFRPSIQTDFESHRYS
jgi:hypothetical protein